MKISNYIKTKEDKQSAILLAVLIVAVIAYIICFYTWLTGKWHVALVDLKVKDGVAAGMWASSARIIYVWFRKNVFAKG